MSTARKIATVEQVPPGFELTEEDLRQLAEAKARMDAGDPGIPHAEIIRLLEERRRAENR
jgi:hypothetical protein